ncbi:myrosinase 1-like [Colias croceus]|uniref:myrosinase 1-like n=1 Tax=Colias crocea TaxID=72248 RepID=UPI001E27BB22|nr:myrosinase 1-like [Colias croceus]
MAWTYTLVLSALLAARCHAQQFPANFQFGAASAAYQVEGGWDADGKGESIWDRLVHTNKDAIAGGATGDIAADSYHLWREDVQMAAQLGLDFYRFSISWPRILPSGLANNISAAGVAYYNNLIDELLLHGIKPVVTMYHWDLPMKLQDLGGWTNPLISDWFESYAAVLYSLYADRVKTWITINEPIVVCDFNYNGGNYAPGIKEPVIAPYLCNKHLMIAHAKAYRLYEREYKHKYDGRISLANNALWIEPFKVPRDIELAELGMEHMIGRYAHPVFSKEGGWPEKIEKHMLELSLKQGYNSSRLPPFTEEEKKFVQGTADFFGFNYYTARQIRPAKAGENGTWFIDGSPELDAMLEVPPGATFGATDLIAILPRGLREMLQYLKKTYGDHEYLITENGYPGWKDMEDHVRIDFIRDHLEQLLIAIEEDNVTVSGYTYWSLLDNFEWVGGYGIRFGIYDVDFNDPKRTRTPRLSAKYYACVIDSNSYNVSLECTNSPSTAFSRTPTNGNVRNSFSVLVSVIMVALFFV